MRALFDHYESAGNAVGDPTDVYVDIIKGGTIKSSGDKIIAKYYVNSAVVSSSVSLSGIGFNSTLSDFTLGSNVIELLYLRTHNLGFTSIIQLSNSSGSFFYAPSCSDGECVNYQVDNNLKLTLQDTSESPDDNTVVAALGTVLYIPAS